MRVSSLAFLVLACAHGVALAMPIEGQWEGGDRAAESIYGTITVRRHSISWGLVPGKPDCKMRFRIVKEPAGTTYKNQTGGSFVVSPQAPDRTFRLSLPRNACTTELSSLRLSVHTDIPDYLALVEYDMNGNPVAYMHFLRKK
jgi:hypothetical protein